jgi:hypothetical protein
LQIVGFELASLGVLAPKRRQSRFLRRFLFVGPEILFDFLFLAGVVVERVAEAVGTSRADAGGISPAEEAER